MGSEPTDPSRPVLPYVSASPQGRGEEPGWHRGPDGLRFVVPPPATWRRVVGPAIRLFLLAPIVGIMLLAVMGAVFQGVRVGGRMLLLVFPLVIIMLAATGGLWAAALTRIVRIARRGRQPFSLRLLGDGTSELTPAPEDPLDAGVWPTSAVADLRLNLVSSYVFVRTVRLEITFRDGEGLVTYIPWPDDGPLIGIEAELRRALGIDAQSDDAAVGAALHA